MTKIWIALFFFSLGAQAQSKIERQVSVSGECLRTLTPDRMRVSLVAQSLEPQAGPASQKAMDQYKKIHERVKKLNLKDLELETSEFNVNEDLEWNGQTRKSRGYRGRMGLTVSTSELSRMGEVLALASELKVQEVSQLSSYSSPELLKKERENCLEEALKNAKAKAEKLAKTAGLRLGPAILIQEQGSASGPLPMPVRAQFKMAMDKAELASSEAPVEAGVQRLNVNVSAVFELQ